MNRLASRAVSFREIAVLFALVPALLSLALPSLSRADVLTAFGTDLYVRDVVQEKGIQEKEGNASKVFDVDTETGALTNVQVITGPGNVQLHSMDRDPSGVLWGIHNQNQLVTIDEATGECTVVATLNDDYGSFLKCPAIAFVGETLYAIVNLGNNLASAPTADFALATVDTTTGMITQTGIAIGGEIRIGQRGHGLAYDSSIGLVHFWYEGIMEACCNGSGSAIEIIDLVQGTTLRVHPDAPLGAGYPLPSQFRAVTDVGNGTFLAAGDGSILYHIHIQITAPDLNEAKAISNGFGYYYSSSTVSAPQGFYSPRAFDTNSDGNVLSSPRYAGSLLQIIGGAQTSTAKSFPQLALIDELEIFVLGQNVHVSSLATDPASGTIYALSHGGLGGIVIERPFPEVETASKGAADAVSLGYLQMIDRSAGRRIDFPDRGLELFAADQSRLGYIVAIAFDDKGTLCGLDSNHNLVAIDPETGAVTRKHDLLTNKGMGTSILVGSSAQLEFNPRNGLFYALNHHLNNGLSQPMVSIDPADGTYTEIGFSGDKVPGTPQSLALGRGGKLFFNLNGEDTQLVNGGATFFSVTPAGVVARRAGIAVNASIYALTQPSNPARPDVHIGLTRNRLIGNDIYNATGAHQTVILKRRNVRRLRGTYFAKVENDGTTPGDFVLAGSASASYFHGGKNVTGDFKRGYALGFGPGAMENFRVLFGRNKGNRLNTVLRFRARSAGGGDAGKAKISLQKRRPKKKKPRKPKPGDFFHR